jgi:EAL domain-containing protein (putative c-di-GMP-specific phosphodiesterase class I)
MGKLKEHGVKAKRLVFEIDEKTMQKELKNLSMLSRALSAMGCMVSIEHYRMESAPECLDELHVDYLKLDRHLVHEIGSSQEHLGTVTNIMELARSKGYLTIAEGVEKPEDLAKLWELGVSQAQGFFIYEPSGEANMDMTGSDDDNKEVNGKATFTHG